VIRITNSLYLPTHPTASRPAPSPVCFFLLNDTATTEIYTLSLHDALPISKRSSLPVPNCGGASNVSLRTKAREFAMQMLFQWDRSEEHTSELQSRGHLVCRLLLEKKKL